MSRFAPAKAFERIWEPIALDLDTGRLADAGFDGGEFSGPAHDTYYDRAYQALLERVAPRFKMTPRELDWMLQEYWNHESS